MGVPQSFQKIIVKPLWLLQYCWAYPVAVAFSSYLFGKHQVEKDVGSWEELFNRTYVEKCSKEIGSLSSEFCRIFPQVLLRNARPSPHVALHEAGFLWLSLSILCILVPRSQNCTSFMGFDESTPQIKGINQKVFMLLLHLMKKISYGSNHLLRMEHGT